MDTLKRINPENDDVEKSTSFSAHKIRHVVGIDLARTPLALEVRAKLHRNSKLETMLEYSQLSDHELQTNINEIVMS